MSFSFGPFQNNARDAEEGVTFPQKSAH